MGAVSVKVADGAVEGPFEGIEEAIESRERVTGGAGAPAYKYGFEHLADLDVDRSCNWLIKGVLPARGMVILYGAPGAGKSFLVLDAALHLACGRDWFGRRTRAPAGVVYVVAEGAVGFRHRAVAARGHLAVPPDTPFAMVAAEPNLGGSSSPDAGTLRREIARQSAAAGFRPALVVFDTLSRCIGKLDESSSADMNQLVSRLTKLGEDLGVCTLVVHHSGKDASRGLRGSSTLQGAADAVWAVTRDPERGTRTFCLEKVKDGADRIQWDFGLKGVDLGPDDDGDPITSCVVEPVGEAGTQPQVGRPSRESTSDLRAKLVLAGIFELGNLGGHDAPEGASMAPGTRAVALDELHEKLRPAVAGRDSSQDSIRAMIGAAIRSARERGWVADSRRDKLAWLTPEGHSTLAGLRPGGAGVDAVA